MIHDAGGRSRFPLLDGCTGDAAFRGERNEHRIWLERRWSGAGDDSAFAMWICHNPSTAGRDEDDPLVRKIVGFTKRHTDLRRLVLANVATYRCTDPSLIPAGMPLRWSDNLDTIRHLSSLSAVTIAAWGIPHPSLERFTAETLGALGGIVLCLGTTRDGHPRHPGRIGYATELETFRT